MSADPTTWGVQPTGFYVPNIDEITTAINNGMRAYVDPDFDTDPDSPDGQVIGVHARQLGLVWEALGRIHDANNPDNAEDELLVEVCKLSGTKEEGPQPTTVIANCTLAAGTLLQKQTAFANILNHPELLFTPAQDYTAASDGTFPVTFVSVNTGPIPVPPSTLTVISAPITGWSAVTNPSAGVLGNNGDTDTTLRARREAELAATGSTTALALQADIQALAGVISCEVLQNLTNYTDVNGVPPHTIEPVVYHSLDLDLSLLAKTIWNNQAAVMTAGTTHITFVDTNGATRDVYYTPVEAVPIYLTYTLATASGYVGSTQVSQDIAAAMTRLATPGAAVKALQAEALALVEGGVTDVTSFHLGTTPAPGGTTNINLTARQIGTFDPANITVTP